MFVRLPRYVGFPNQIYVQKQFAFDSFIKTFNGKTPLFVSTYRFKDRTTPVIDSMVFDIDSHFGYRIPYKNVKSLKEFCDQHGLSYLINFSGGKGFHFFITFKEKIPKNEQEKQLIKDTIYSVQEALVKECDIGAIDYPTMGRLHFLIRFPTSKYVRFEEGKLTTNGMYCRNIPIDEFEQGSLSASLKHISKIAKEPGVIPKRPRTVKTLEDIVGLLPNFKLHLHTNGRDKIEVMRAGMTAPTLEAVGVPCLKKIAQNTHPNHRERIELASFLKLMGYTDLAIVAFIKQLGWKDYAYAITSYQVSTVKPRFPDCKYLSRSYKELCSKCTLRGR